MIRQAVLFAPCVLFFACASTGDRRTGGGESPNPISEVRAAIAGVGERAGLLVANDAYGDHATRLVYLEQGWGPAETLWYYHADQGSVLMPYDVFVSLEQADSEAPFIQPEHLARFRFLNQHKTPNNPDALPVGFTRHEDRLGLTCAACHTGQINYRGTAMRIDGTPALANVTGLFHAVRAALSATLSDEKKLARFAERVRGGGKDDAQREAPRKRLSETLAWFESYESANRSNTVEGFARMDAIGRILNQVIRFTSDPRNSLEPNAPASFPVLWDAPRHDFVQWVGFAPNAGAGSIGRNAGEVIGVFGHIDVKHYDNEKEAKRGYQASIKAQALVDMEETLRTLKSPRWPDDILPPIQKDVAARGKSLYENHCASCHAVIDRDDPRRKITAMVTGIDVVGTDDTSATNLIKARAPAGVLEGAISPSGKRYAASESVLTLLSDLVTRTLSAQPVAALRAVANAKLHGLETTAKKGNHKMNTEQDPTVELRCYKARPLNGIWASSPYLHNGSVPTLHDLLLPPAQRPVKFALGRWEFDPRKVGYVSDGTEPFVLDTTVKGNGNQGHEFGVSLPEADRWALVEYLKTL